MKKQNLLLIISAFLITQTFANDRDDIDPDKWRDYREYVSEKNKWTRSKNGFQKEVNWYENIIAAASKLVQRDEAICNDVSRCEKVSNILWYSGFLATVGTTITQLVKMSGEKSYADMPLSLYHEFLASRRRIVWGSAAGLLGLTWWKYYVSGPRRKACKAAYSRQKRIKTWKKTVAKLNKYNPDHAGSH